MLKIMIGKMVKGQSHCRPLLKVSHFSPTLSEYLVHLGWWTLLDLGWASVLSRVLLAAVLWPYEYMIPRSCGWAAHEGGCEHAVLSIWRCTLAFFSRAEVESRNYRRTAAMKGIPLDQRDEDWELKKEELERDPPCSRENYPSSAQKKIEKKRRKQ